MNYLNLKCKRVKLLRCNRAVIPAETDTVILQEDIPKASDQFKIPESLRKGANTRRSGEDKKKEVLFNMGYKLRSQDLALLASAEFLMYRFLKDYGWCIIYRR